MDDKSRDMVKKLKEYGLNHGFAVWQGSVVIVGPGAPYSVYPTSFGSADLEGAIKAGLFEQRRLSGALELDIYAVKQK